MTDAFADLWNSSTPIKQAPAAQKLGSAVPPANDSKRPRPDVFSLLSSAGSSAPSSRPLTPSTAGQAAGPKPIKSTASGDAFSGLVAGSLGSTSNGANMTIAERAAKAEKERIENLQKRQQASKVQTSTTWDGLDTLAQFNSLSTVPTHAPEDDWDLGPTLPSKPASNTLSVSEEDDWGLGDFTSTPSGPLLSESVPPAAPRSQTDIWDLGDFSAVASTSRPEPISEPVVPRSNSPGDFDFGERQDGLDDDSADEDDILGVLSKPIDSISKYTPPASRATLPSQPDKTSRTGSPPPHIIGQIVEMGFSPQQARVALAATDTGLDVQGALDMLLSNGVGTDSLPPPLPERQRPRDRVEEPVPRQRAPTRNTKGTIDTPSPSGSQQELNLQDQADKLLAQASEIGLSVFNRANAFWAQGRERVQKVYEERTKASASRTLDSRQGGRPKWMQDETPAHGDEGWQDAAGGFSDEVLPPKPSRLTRPKKEPRPQPQLQATEGAADLFSDEPVAYVSPFRRGRPVRAPITDAPPPRSSSPKPVPRPPSPIPLTQRQTVPASSSEITSSARHKSIGAEKFKLGQYGEAEAAYTAAIDLLPESHLLLVPLYNNRALTRLKTGDHTGVVEDATMVIGIVGPSYHPRREAKVLNESDGAGVDLGDGLVKAWRRRAEAYEGKEKWTPAQKDWEAVAAADWVGGKLRSEAVSGAGRCRRTASANNADSGTSTKPSPKSSLAKPSVPRPPVRRRPTPPSQALSKLREANDAAEAEDEARHELKDMIDSRLLAWKGGKESNIRALIASLDSVLWPELGWQKVGMGELISPSQVKIRYTKAIAKLHPDKLNTNNTTLEQRMIANGVFGTLNEAWNSFKQ